MSPSTGLQAGRVPWFWRIDPKQVSAISRKSLALVRRVGVAALHLGQDAGGVDLLVGELPQPAGELLGALGSLITMSVAPRWRAAFLFLAHAGVPNLVGLVPAWEGGVTVRCLQALNESRPRTTPGPSGPPVVVMRRRRQPRRRQRSRACRQTLPWCSSSSSHHLESSSRTRTASPRRSFTCADLAHVVERLVPAFTQALPVALGDLDASRSDRP